MTCRHLWILALLCAPALAQEDVRPNADASAEEGTDCTAATVDAAMDNEVDDAWNTADDCIDDSCDVATDSTFVTSLPFATPSANPTTVTDDQVFAMRARLCDSGQSGTPQARMDAYCNGVLVESGTLQNLTWNAGEGSVLTEAWTFNAGTCAADGSDVEILVYCDAVAGGPTVRVGCDFDAIEWRATVSSADDFMLIGSRRRAETVRPGR